MTSSQSSKLGLVIVLSALMTIFAANSFAQPAGPSEEFDFMEMADTNKDGKVTKDEFRGPSVLFDQWDKNKDGIIDESEAPTEAPQAREGTFTERYDFNKDGRVTRDEFAASDYMFSQMDKNKDGGIVDSELPAPGDPAEIIKLADENQDGKLSEEEWFGPPGSFSQIDKNGDGFIEPSEMPPPREQGQGSGQAQAPGQPQMQ